jgi:hypothetical protein
MANTIRIKRRSAAGASGAPATLAPAELAYNENDNTLYYGFGDGGSGNSSSIVSVAGSGAFMTTGTTQTISASKTFSNITISGGSISGITDLAVSDGGTGASSPSSARTNLGAAASGSNSDITSITGLTTALSVGQGGTGSTTASGARSNLSAAASGANSDITSITGLTTSLTVAQGGTGATTASSARTNLLPAYTSNGGKVLAVNSGGTDVEYITPNAGTVTSVGITAPLQSIITVGFSPVTTSGNISLTFNAQAMNTMLMGPTSGANAIPAFRALTAADVPPLSYFSSSGGTVSGNVVVTGSLEVQGSLTTISSTTLTVADKNIELAKGSTTEAGATGGGITLHGLVDHTILYTTGTSSWDFSEHVNLVTGKAFKINGTTVLSATAINGVDIDGGSF